MTKSDLRTGMIVTTRSGSKYVVFLNTMTIYQSDGYVEEDRDVIVNINGRSWNLLKYYTEELLYEGYGGYNYGGGDDIMKVEIANHPADFINGLKESDKFETIWERNEVKEVTMAEVEEKFGCKVKIVKE